MINNLSVENTTTLKLPWPPSINHYWRLGQGHFHISSEGRAYKFHVADIIASARIRPLDGPVKIIIDAFPPDRRRRDLDNLNKCLFDSCVVRKGFAVGLYHDDCQIKRIESTMWDFDPDHAGYVILTIAPWSEGQSAAVPVCPIPSPLAAAAARPLPIKGAAPWPPHAPEPSSPLATATSPTTVTPRWRRFVAWWKCFALPT